MSRPAIGNRKMSRSVFEWREGIDRAYPGGLAEFPDAPTIRIMFGFCSQWLAEHWHISRTIENRADREWFDANFGEEIERITKIRDELNQWLSQKGLPEMITYDESKGFPIRVKLEGKIVGDIRRDLATGKFFYRPKRGGRGDLFATVAEVKRSLEAE